jgi:hypothetical protein
MRQTGGGDPHNVPFSRQQTYSRSLLVKSHRKIRRARSPSTHSARGDMWRDIFTSKSGVRHRPVKRPLWRQLASAIRILGRELFCGLLRIMRSSAEIFYRIYGSQGGPLRCGPACGPTDTRARNYGPATASGPTVARALLCPGLGISLFVHAVSLRAAGGSWTHSLGPSLAAPRLPASRPCIR